MSVETKLDLNNEKFCQSDGSILTLSGDTKISSLGTLKYLTNQSVNYDARSIPDVQYVTGLTNTISSRVTTIESLYVTGGTNGLNKVGKNIKLGGTLTENTTIGGPYTLNICNNAKLNTQLGYQISGNTMLRTSNKTISSLYIGYNTSSNGCGTNNIGIGSCVLSATTIGFNNIGIGGRALTKNDGGHDNIGIGSDTLSIEQNAIANIAIGTSSLRLLTNGEGNIGLGYESMSQCIVNGCFNTGIGNNSLKYLTNGCFNLGIGVSSLLNNTTGIENIAYGHSSLLNNGVGSYNLGFGYRSLYCNNGNCNIGIGNFAGYSKIMGDNNIFIGNCSGYNVTGSNRLYVANNATCNLILGDFTGNTITFPTVKICNTPNNGTVNDSILVWNSTDKTIKKINSTDLFITSITGSTNGLTTTGRLIKLGGILTGNTNVCTNLNNLILGGLYSKLSIIDKCPTASGCFKSEYSSTSGSTCISSNLQHTFGNICLGVCNSSSPFNSKSIEIDWNGEMKINDSVRSKGIIYNADYSSNFTNESLVTKRYVTGLTVNAGMQCAVNGLTKVGNAVILGGELTGDTKIYGCGVPFSLGCNTNYLGAYGIYADSISQYTINDYLSCSVGNTLLTATGNLSLKGFNIFLNSLTKYDADYSSTYTTRSLVDKGYVTGLTNSITTNYVCSANNGLNKIGNNIRLGGPLTGNTSITGAYTLGFSNTILNLTGSTCVNISGLTKLLTTPSAGLSTDKILVWNSTDKNVKSIDASTISNLGITDGTNGLTKTGTKLKLGGTLTGDTVISGAYSLGFNNTIVNLTGSTCINLTGPTRLITTPATGVGTDSILVWNSTDKIVKSVSCSCINAGNVTSANNGLNKVGQNVRLGGALTGNTSITGAYTLGFNNTILNLMGSSCTNITGSTCINLTGPTKLITTPATGVGTDSILVWNSTDKIVKSVSCSCINAGNITSANNGLNKVGQNVRLGGSLTGNTSITGAYTLGFNNTILNLTGSTCINLTGPTRLVTTPATGVGSDSILVWNSTDKCVKIVSNTTVLSNAVTGSTNGLSKVGQNLKLGGLLSETTLICGNNNNLTFGCNGSLINSYNVCSVSNTQCSTGAINIFSNSIVSLKGSSINACSLVNYDSDLSSSYTNRSLVDKAYVDSVATGLDVKTAVTVATTADITLSGLQTVDGVSLTAGMRVLVKNQTTQWRNGIYDAASTAWTRSSDYDFSLLSEINNGDLISVLSGTTNANSIWALTTPNPIVSGSTLTFTKFLQQTGVISGNGINITNVGINKQIAVNLDTNSGLIFNGTAMAVDWNKYRTGLCVNNYKVDLRVTKCASVGTEIPVSINTGGTNTLYVDSSTINTCLGTPITTANNGLNKVGSNVRLGGALTGNTSITGAYTLGFNNTILNLTGSTAVNISGPTKLISTPATGAGTDGILVWNSTDKCVKTISCASINSNNITTANNGLNKVGSNVRLGGVLTGNTSITGAFTLGFNNTILNLTGSTSVNISGPTKLISTPATGAGTDGILVWNSTDKCVKTISCATINSNNITTANNGLTKSSQNVRLGGALTGNTSITGAYTLGFNNTILNLTGSSFVNISGPTKLISTPATGAGTDNILVWNSTDKIIKSISSSNTLLSTYLKLDQTVPQTLVGSPIMSGLTATRVPYIDANGQLKDTNVVYDPVKEQVQIGTIAGYVSGYGLTVKKSIITDGELRVGGGNPTFDFNSIKYGSNNSYLIKNTNTGATSAIEIWTKNTKTATFTPTQGLDVVGKICSDSLNVANGINVTGATKLYTTPSTGVSTDSVLVWNSTDKCVKSFDATNVLGSSLTGSTNGLTVASRKVKLGGALTENTSITGAFTLGMSNTYVNITGSTCVNISGPTRLLSTPATGVGTDKILVWNSTDKIIKSVDSTVLNSGITGGTNGLTVTGRNLKLGGTLTGNTTINTSTNSMNINGNGLYSVCTACISNCAGNGGSTYTRINQTNTTISLLHCNTSLTQCSSINMCNSEITSAAATNYCVNAGSRALIIGAVCSCLDLTSSIGTLKTVGTSVSSYFTTCSNGNAYIYGCNGVDITSPHVNGISLCAAVRIPITPGDGATTDSVLMWNSSDKCIKKLPTSSFGDKNNIYSSVIIDASTGLTNTSEYVILINHTLPVTITLPASPTNGLTFKLKDVSTVGALTHNITIGRNGKLIDRQSSDALINTDTGAMELMYNSTLGSWFSLSFIN